MENNTTIVWSHARRSNMSPQHWQTSVRVYHKDESTDSNGSSRKRPRMRQVGFQQLRRLNMKLNVIRFTKEVGLGSRTVAHSNRVKAAIAQHSYGRSSILPIYWIRSCIAYGIAAVLSSRSDRLHSASWRSLISTRHLRPFLFLFIVSSEFVTNPILWKPFGRPFDIRYNMSSNWQELRKYKLYGQNENVGICYKWRWQPVQRDLPTQISLSSLFFFTGQMFTIDSANPPLPILLCFRIA